MATKVGYIGLGAMGLPLAKHLQRKGFDVNAFDIVPGRAEQIVELGGRKAGPEPHKVLAGRTEKDLILN